MYAALRVTPPEAPPGLHGDGALSRFLWSVLLRDSLPSLLRFEDRNSMAFSIEARVPLLDRALVELAMGLPVEWKLGGGQLKRVLREALRARAGGDSRPAGQDRLHRADRAVDARRPERVVVRPAGVEVVSRARLLPAPGRAPAGRAIRAHRRILRASARATHTARAANLGLPSACTHLATAIWRLAIVEQWARQFLDG